MAWCPFAVHKPITKSRSVIVPRAVIAHTAVSGAASLYGYFSGVGDDSHFYIDSTGRIEQYVDTARSAYANRNANSFAVSIETWDNRDPARTPWTAAQVASIIRLNNWLADTHPTIPRRQITDPYGSGLGWHAMFGAPSAWTSAVGKTCPGAPRIEQMRSTIIPAFIGNTSPQEELVATAAEIQAIAKATVNELMSRGVTTGEPETKNEIPFSRHVRYTQFDAAKAAAGVQVLLGRSQGASAEEIAAKLLPALTAAVVAEVAQQDAISDEDAQQIAQAVTDRAAALLGGGQ